MHTKVVDRKAKYEIILSCMSFICKYRCILKNIFPGKYIYMNAGLVLDCQRKLRLQKILNARMNYFNFRLLSYIVSPAILGGN